MCAVVVCVFDDDMRMVLVGATSKSEGVCPSLYHHDQALNVDEASSTERCMLLKKTILDIQEFLAQEKVLNCTMRIPEMSDEKE